MATKDIRDLGILITLIGAIYTTLSVILGENLLYGIFALVSGGFLILLSLLLTEQKSVRKTRTRRKKRETKRAALYRVSPKTEQKMPGEKIYYTTSITNLLSDKISGKIEVSIPEGWKIDKKEIDFGPVKKEETEDVGFEVEIPKDAKLGFVYKVNIKISFLDYSHELSAVVELLSQEDELLTIEEDEEIMQALEGK